MSAVMEVLRHISEKTDSFGCILWQEVPPEGGSSEPELFVLADWFPNQLHCANHGLKIASSKTGTGITENRQIVIDSVKREIENPDPFLIERRIHAFCTTPIRFGDGRRGAVNIYRNRRAKYSKKTQRTASELALLVPMLYDIIRGRVSSSLLQRITEITRTFDPHVPLGGVPLDHARASVAQIVNAVAKAFNCFEVSVFFEDSVVAPRQYALAATTDVSLTPMQSYQPGNEHGITGWTLDHPDAHVRVFDLPSFDQIAIGRVYPGMMWKDSLNIGELVRRKQCIPDQQPLPPLSFMAAPVLRGNSVIGVIRCCVAYGPTYFAPSDYSILQMVAAHLASHWGTILDRREIDAETEALEKLVDRMVSLNDVVHTEIAKRDDEKSILTAALRVISSVIPDAVINDVRLLSEDKKELRFVAFDGAAWTLGTPEEVNTRRQRVYALDGETPGSAGAYVVHSGKVCVIDDVTKNPYYLKNFPDTKKMIIAPIQLQDSEGGLETYGVLDVRSTTEQPFPRYAEYGARLLGSQLALYKKLSATVRDLENLNQVHVRLTEDMAHQLMSPLLIAKGRVQQSLKKAVNDQPMTDILLEVRGAISRAIHVCSNLDIFVRLERDGRVPVELEEITGRELTALLINTSRDTARLRDNFVVARERPIRSLWDGSFSPRRRIVTGRYTVQTEGFEKVDKIKTDRRLLEQVLTQVLDNAFKYSYVGSTVEVEGGYTAATRRRDRIERQRIRPLAIASPEAEKPSDERKRRIRISVINEGIELSNGDSQRVTDRGFQSDDAKKYSQGGSGIGLWIVREIMEALGGELEIHPTDGRHRTEIALLFPVE